MEDFNLRNKWILVGSLGAVFLITLGFSYGPGYGGSLLAFLGANNTRISSSVSPSDMVTPVVTQKKVVTSKTVTTVTTMSPSVSPITYSDYGNNVFTQTPTITPRPSMSPSVSPHIPTTTPVAPVISPVPVVSPTPSMSPSVETTPSSTPVQDSPTPTSTPEATPTPTPFVISNGDVVINEIAWMGTGADKTGSDEWMELFNTTNQTITLDGWSLEARDGTPHILLSGTINPQGFYLLERTSDSTINDVVADKVYTGALGNSGEFIELKNETGVIIDSLDATGGWPAGANPSGNLAGRASMERIDPYKSGGDITNWGTNNGTIKNGHDAQGNPINGTPGSANSVATL